MEKEVASKERGKTNELCGVRLKSEIQYKLVVFNRYKNSEIEIHVYEHIYECVHIRKFLSSVSQGLRTMVP